MQNVNIRHHQSICQYTNKDALQNNSQWDTITQGGTLELIKFTRKQNYV